MLWSIEEIYPIPFLRKCGVYNTDEMYDARVTAANSDEIENYERKAEEGMRDLEQSITNYMFNMFN